MDVEFKGIDHIHVNVTNRERSEKWYNAVLGLARVNDLEFWATNDGPLMLKDKSESVQLALFENQSVQNTTIALRVSGIGLMSSIQHLDAFNIEYELVDHDVAWSIYFKDLDSNPFEITTYEYENFRDLKNDFA